MITRRWRSGAWAAASALCLLAALLCQRVLTASMALHMLAHIPLLVVAGVLANRAWWTARTSAGHAAAPVAARAAGDPSSSAAAEPAGEPSTGARYNEFGIPGLLFASLAGAYWMIPKALDDVLTSPSLNVLKYVALMVAGFVLMDSLRRANRVITLFFVGNFCWMSAIVGLLYQDNPVRLCNFYLLGDQEIAGQGLVWLAIGLPLFWLALEIKPVWRFLGR